MQVLIISPTQTGIGGIAQHVQGLAAFLQKNGNTVDILSSENTFTLPIKGLKNPSFMLSAFLKTKFKKGNDIVHAHNLPSAFPMKHASGKKILTLHGIYSKQVDVIHGQTTGKISSSYEKDALTWADAITVISSEAYDYYTELGFKVYLVPNAIDISSLTQKKERLYDKQIIFAGRLSKEKGILDLLEMSKK
ncbi:MAG: glycosyltransferase family 4 protein, partial [Nitrosotalea sp.]